MFTHMPPERLFRVASVTCLILILLVGGTVPLRSEPACHVILELTPQSPMTMNEGGTEQLIVRAYYDGDKEELVTLSASNLPSFAKGWEGKSIECANCILADTIYFEPGYCDAHTYNMKFKVTANAGKGSKELEDEKPLKLIVNNVDHPCTISSNDSCTIMATKQLAFDISVEDPDSECQGEPKPSWVYTGYPFEHGAYLTEGDYLRTFVWTPTGEDVGTFPIEIEIQIGNSRCHKVIMITVEPVPPDCVWGPPITLEEPPFTKGTSNEVCYIPNCEAYDHQVCYFDSLNPDTILGCWLPDMFAATVKKDSGYPCVTFEGLLDGHTYGFFVVAYFEDDPDSYLPAEEYVFSTQDASPPDEVTTTTARAEAGGKVVVEWNGVTDAVSWVTKYEIFRMEDAQEPELVDVVGAATGNDETTQYVYRDDIYSGSGLTEGVEYHFMVRAVDYVGNEGSGIWTGRVVPDATPPCSPSIRIACDFRFALTCYLGSTDATVLGRPDTIPECITILKLADYIRFECVRDSVKFFDSKWAPGFNYFESPWVRCNDLDWIEHVFNLLPSTGDEMYVHGHKYLFRAQAKDSVGNIGEWSRIDFAYVDILPPGDIANLTVESNVDAAGTHYSMELDWNPAPDPVSKVKEYHVYRKNEEGEFDMIGTAPTPGFVDETLDLAERVAVCYRVGSADNIGNTRDWTMTEWEACGLVPVGPYIMADCAYMNAESDTCFIAGDVVTVYWTGYDNTGVDYYEIECNGSTYPQNDPAADHREVTVPDDILYTIRARAFFTDGLGSTWSNTVYIMKDSTPPDPVTDLTVTNAEESCKGFYLEWTEPYDDHGIGGYIIYRWGNGEEPDSIDTIVGRATSYCVACTSHCPHLTNYEYYHFEVQPADIVWNVQTEGNNSGSDYCNCPPTISCPDSEPIDSFRICWEPHYPRSEDVIYCEYIVRMMLYWYDDISGEVEEELIGEFPKSDTCFSYSVEGLNDGYYTFWVKEIPHGVGSKESAWSEPCTVPLGVIVPPVEDLVCQPQPLPKGKDTQTEGVIVIHWKYPDYPWLDCFFVERDGQQICKIYPDTLSDEYACTDSGLAVHTMYGYEVYACNKFDNCSDIRDASCSIDPIWMYTPRVRMFDPHFFNSDTLTVCWEWVDEAKSVISNIHSACSCRIQASTDSRFRSVLYESGWYPAGEECAPLIVNELPVGIANRDIFLRARAMDCWGEISPWSTDYFEPAYTMYDTMPPNPVDDLQISTKADSSTADNIIDVYLEWSSIRDYMPGSGLSHYTVIRRDPTTEEKSLVCTVEAPCTECVDPNVIVEGYNSCLFEYTVQPVDNIGNEQSEGDTVCLETLPEPYSCSATSCKKFSWEYGEFPADHFFAECSYDSTYLGTGWMKFLPIEAQDTTSGNMCLAFQTDAEFCDHPVIYFHVKSVWKNLESPWSRMCKFGDPSITLDHVPNQYGLYQNVPNPFNPATKISFDVSTRGRVIIQVFNIKGQLIRCLVDETYNPGSYSIEWSGTNDRNERVSSGIYFCRIKINEYVSSKKMVLLR